MSRKIEAAVDHELHSNVREIVDESVVYASMSEFVRHALAEKVERERGG
jgi:Arc/MetJ-type ribon-helix-helix transcriptional regulator